MWQLTRDSANLDLNSPYCYMLLCLHHPETCMIAESGDNLAGFITGYLPPRRPDALFVWQIAVAPEARRMGLGRRMVEAVLNRQIDNGVRYLEATVTPTNEASRRLFKAVARDRGAQFAESSCFEPDHFPPDEGEENLHEPERLLRIGPFDGPEVQSQDSDRQRRAATCK